MASKPSNPNPNELEDLDDLESEMGNPEPNPDGLLSQSMRQTEKLSEVGPKLTRDVLRRMMAPHRQEPVYLDPRPDMIGLVPKIPAGMQVDLVFRPDLPFRMSGFGMVNGSPSPWIVHAIIIGIEQQLALLEEDIPDGIPFYTFRGRETRMTFSTAEPGAEIRIRLSHRHTEAIGAEIMLFGMHAEQTLATQLSKLDDPEYIEELYTLLGRKLANR